TERRTGAGVALGALATVGRARGRSSSIDLRRSAGAGAARNRNFARPRAFGRLMHTNAVLRGMSEHRSSLLVTALSAAFGVAMVQATSFLVTLIAADDISSRSSVQVALVLVASAFIAIAVYVGAIVTANTFATIIAGRTRTIALMRLIGSSASAQRHSVARQ